MSSILLKQISCYPLYNSEKVLLMKLNRIEPLNPYQRARRLGLQSSFLPKVGMSQAVQETMNFAKKKDRSNLKVPSNLYSCINGKETNITKLMQLNNYFHVLIKQKEGILLVLLSNNLPKDIRRLILLLLLKVIFT